MPKPSQVPRGTGATTAANSVLASFPRRRRHMAKGRKFTSSRSERFLGTAYTQGSTAADPSTELREEDVWSTTEDRELHVTLSPGEWDSREAPRRRIRHDSREEEHHRQVGGLSLAFEDPTAGNNGGGTTRIVHQYRSQDSVAPQRGRRVASSAPVNVPDWSKILRVESLHEMDDGFEDGDGESEIVPPHEYLARSRKMAANSVFEGVGRTLKGRDLRRVRDAVWSQTGFYG